MYMYCVIILLQFAMSMGIKAYYTATCSPMGRFYMIQGLWICLLVWVVGLQNESLGFFVATSTATPISSSSIYLSFASIKQLSWLKYQLCVCVLCVCTVCVCVYLISPSTKTMLKTTKRKICNYCLDPTIATRLKYNENLQCHIMRSDIYTST